MLPPHTGAEATFIFMKGERNEKNLYNVNH